MKKIFILMVLFFSVIANAQQDLTVTVVDESQKPTQNITISLENKGRNFNSSQTTNKQGKATFRNLESIDGYQIVFSGDNEFGSQKSDLITIRSNQNPGVSLVLRKINPNQLQEVIIKSTGTSKINTQDAEVSFELKASEIQKIPVEGRDITRVLYRLPNVTQATGFYPEAPNVSVNGANGLFTSYLIDGLDNNERFLGGQKFNIPAGFVKDITVLSSNFSAEYGLTGSGVIDITPKSGSNKLTGEIFSLSRPGAAVDGQSLYTQRDLSGNQIKNAFQRYQAGVGVGGAFVKDKTFYYFNIEHTSDIKDNLLKAPELNVYKSIRGYNNFDYFSTKIDQNWSKNFRSSLRANIGIVGIERQGGGLDGGVTFGSAGNTQRRNSILLAFKNAYNFGNISAETNIQYSRFRWDYANPVNVNSPQVVVLGTNNETLAILGHPGYVFNSLENTIQLQQKFKYYVNNHTFKAGFNFIRGNHELLGGGNPNGNYTVKLNQAQIDNIKNRNIGNDLSIFDIPSNATVLSYNVELRPAQFGTNQDIYSVYAEDLWSVNSKLNLTFGLRYDYDNLSKGGSKNGDTNNIAPRFNFNYKLNENSSIRGGYGIAYDKINYAIYSDALQQNTKSADYKTQLREFIRLGILPSDTDIEAITFNGNVGASLSGIGYLQAPATSTLQAQREGAFANERRILNPNGYQNPYSHQFALGYQTKLDDNKLFFVDFVHNRGENLFRLRNLNAASEFPNNDPNNVIVRTPAQADATRPIPITAGSATINGNIVTGVARNVVVTESAGKSRYYAMSVNYQKDKGTDNYDYRVNYTLSSLKNDTEDINFRPQDGNNYGNEYGPSINDRTHNINGIFNYYPFKGTTLTFAGLLQSGQPINRIPLGYGTTDLNGDGSGFGDAYVGNSDRFPGESRNSDRLPWNTTFDFGAQHQIKLSDNTRLEFRIDVFNALNAENLSGYSNNATQSNQIQAGSLKSGLFVKRNSSPPRQVQFGVRFLF
jgi:outer membrane receptor for ferrienterochelin and colicin